MIHFNFHFYEWQSAVNTKDILDCQSDDLSVYLFRECLLLEYPASMLICEINWLSGILLTPFGDR